MPACKAVKDRGIRGAAVEAIIPEMRTIFAAAVKNGTELRI
ncbi:MAG: hypothetical protein V1875_10065 [Candidatus Altiarchaeota archaeon]